MYEGNLGFFFNTGFFENLNFENFSIFPRLLDKFFLLFVNLQPISMKVYLRQDQHLIDFYKKSAPNSHGSLSVKIQILANHILE